MKKILPFLFILCINNCYSATGNASDGELLALSVLVIISLILGTGYFIDFLKRLIKTAVEKRRAKRNTMDEDFNDAYFPENATFSQGLYN